MVDPERVVVVEDRLEEDAHHHAVAVHGDGAAPVAFHDPVEGVADPEPEGWVVASEHRLPVLEELAHDGVVLAHLLGRDVLGAVAIGFLESDHGLGFESEASDQGVSRLDGPAHRAGDDVFDALPGEQVGRHLGLASADVGQGRVGALAVGAGFGLGPCVSEDEQFHGGGAYGDGRVRLPEGSA